MKMALQIAGTTVVDNSRNLTNVTIAEGLIPNLNASKITAGTISTARLGSGTANSTTYLRGDNVWSTVASLGLGDGQSWASYSRANNTTYTNSTTRTTAVAANAVGTGSFGCNEQIFVNGNQILRTSVDAAFWYGSHFFIVPPNNTWRVNFNTGVSSIWILM
jgi:hypothetical protein